MEKLLNYFDNLYETNKISHSYLIGNVFYDDIKEELSQVIKKYFINNLNNIENNPDIIILKDDENGIKKEDIKDLINKINNTSQFNSCKIYIIENADKLNDFSCNALLKTLEEPPENVYAFLLSSNIDEVKDTIYSRCQKIFVSSTTSSQIEDEEISKLSDEIIDAIEKDKLKVIAKNYDFYSIISDRNVFFKILNNVLYKYEKSLKEMLKSSGNNIICKNNNIDEISRKIIVINDNINLLRYPVNKNLIIDRFIIEMWRCKNENC